MNPYEALNVDKLATDEEIKAAYRKLAKEHHPDKKGASRKMQEINAAYAILKNPEKRKHFDETGQTDSQNAENRVMQAVTQIINELVKNNPADIFKELSEMEKSVTKQKQDNVKKIEADINWIEKFLKRIKKCPENPLVKKMLENNIRGLQTQISKIDIEFDFFYQAVTMIREYDFETREPDMWVNIDGMNFGGFATEWEDINPDYKDKRGDRV